MPRSTTNGDPSSDTQRRRRAELHRLDSEHNEPKGSNAVALQRIRTSATGAPFRWRPCPDAVEVAATARYGERKTDGKRRARMRRPVLDGVDHQSTWFTTTLGDRRRRRGRGEPDGIHHDRRKSRFAVPHRTGAAGAQLMPPPATAHRTSVLHSRRQEALSGPCARHHQSVVTPSMKHSDLSPSEHASPDTPASTLRRPAKLRSQRACSSIR